MDGTNRPVEVDSASTAHEVVTQISANLGIVDTFGFSIYVKLFDKVSNFDFLNKKTRRYPIHFR